MDDLIKFPAFDLPVVGVSVKICEWEGNVDPFGKLTKAWVQIEGIPPMWCSWKVFPKLLLVLASLWMWIGMGFLRAFMN